MAKCRVLAKSFINNAIREEGEIVEFEGKLGENLELVEEEEAQAKPAKKWKKGAEAEPVETADAE
jgi:hypothetical protein